MRTALLVLVLAIPAVAQDGPAHAWNLVADKIDGSKVKATAGPHDGTVVGTVAFAAEPPKALVLKGEPKNTGRIDLTADLAKAGLPTEAISVEAWVRVDKPTEWGGILGAFQDNGPYEKGWILGYNHTQFFFALASTGRKDLTYLKARTPFLPGSWYHVVGTYDGKEQRIYLDGRLQGASTDQKGPIDYPPKGFYALAAYRDDNELYPLLGRLETVSVFARALSAEEVLARFDARKKLFPGVEPAGGDAVADWPTFLRDNRRGGATEEVVPLPTGLVWSRRFRRLPAPAWPDEAKADYYHNKADWKARVDYDFVFHTVGVGERVWLGSSSEDKVVCLDATTGLVRWQFHTEGPVRCAPTFHAGRLYFGSDDGYVYCLEAESGKLVWRTRIADSALRVPGNQRMISLWPVRTDVLIDGGKGHVCAGVFPSQGVYQATLDLKDGTITAKQTLQVTAQGYLERKFGKLMVGTGRNPAGALIAELEKTGKEPGKAVHPLKDYPFALVTAGDVHFAGGDGKVAALAKDTYKPLWTATVEGKAYGLMVLRGRLFVSTDAGLLYCFAADAPERPMVREPFPPVPWPGVLPRSLLPSRDGKVGYWLVAGKDVGANVYQLASVSRMQVVGLTADATEARNARAMLDAAGLAGRATVHEGSLEKLPYTSNVFTEVDTETSPVPQAEVVRVTSPHSGWYRYLGPSPGYDKPISWSARRQPLDGEGAWTHQYGDVGNTACSGDELVGSELQIQWFGKPGPRTMIDRHHRAASPLYLAGRMFVPGEDVVTGVDAYNGTILWEKTIPDSRRVVVFRDASQFALAPELVHGATLHVAAGDRCLSLDPQTGKEMKEIPLPKLGKAPAYEWDYVARVNNLLVGSASKKGSIRREQNHQQTTNTTHWDFVPAVGSDFAFAYDRDGRLRWTYESKAGLLINQTFTIGGGRFYFVESDNPDTLATPIGRHPYAALTGNGATLVALDLVTGKVVYRQPLPELKAVEHNCFAVFKDGKLVLAGSRNDGTDKKTARLWYDVHVYDAATGKRLWTASQNQQVPINCEHGEQERHPTVVGDKLYCEPKAYDLATGKPIEWNWPWQTKQRRGCGTLSASASAFFFRDETCQAFDLTAGKVSPVTTETRPGCWINMLPAGGLVLVPEGSSGCTCNHSVQTSLALIPKKDVPKR